MANTYKLINVGLNTVIKSSNIVAVKKYRWDLTEEQVPSYLSNYENNEIKVGELISSEGDKNTYVLDSGGPDTYNLLLFVSNKYSLEDINLLNPKSFSCIGALELPEIGLGRDTTREYIEITFEEVDPDLSPEDILIVKDVEVRAEVKFYEQAEVGIEEGIFPEEEARKYFPKTGKYAMGDKNILSYVPGGVVYHNQFFKNERLGLDFSNFIGVVKTTSINHNKTEYLRILDGNGDIVLRDIYIHPTGVVEKTTSSIETVVLKEPQYEVLVNPDMIIVTNLVNRTKFGISTPLYTQGNYNTISSTPESIKVPLNRALEFGTDLATDNLTTVASHPGQDTWFLQSSYRDIFHKIDILQQESLSYKVIEHNTKIFILGETNINGSTIRKYAVDYKGKVVNVPMDYVLDIDGYLLINTSSGWEGYKSDLSSKLSMGSVYDLYSLIPSATELIWENQVFDPKKIVICRDRIQEIN